MTLPFVHIDAKTNSYIKSEFIKNAELGSAFLFILSTFFAMTSLFSLPMENEVAFF